MDLYSLIASANRYPQAAPSSDAEIAAAEQDLGLSFSDDYRQFLRQVGGCVWAGHEITGLVKDDYLNVVSATRAQRRLNPEVYRSWYVLENTRNEGIIIWQDQDGSVYLTQRGTNPLKLASSLPGYLSLED